MKANRNAQILCAEKLQRKANPAAKCAFSYLLSEIQSKDSLSLSAMVPI